MDIIGEMDIVSDVGCLQSAMSSASSSGDSPGTGSGTGGDGCDSCGVVLVRVLATRRYIPAARHVQRAPSLTRASLNNNTGSRARRP